MKKVKFCKECKWSVKSKTTYEIRCTHPNVVIEYPWALSHMEYGNESGGFECGKSCYEERGRKWFAPCGIKGKLWEERKKAIIPPGDE